MYHVRASGKGITLGGVAEDDGFNVKMPAHFQKPVTFGGTMESSDFHVKQLAHFHNGLREDIQVVESGNCNNLTESGNYYIGSSGSNKPGDGTNGWLTVKAYGTNGAYCYQEYVTSTGLRYYRMRENTIWGSWVQDVSIIFKKFTFNNVAATKRAINGLYYGTISTEVSLGITGTVLSIVITDWGGPSSMFGLYSSGGSIEIMSQASQTIAKLSAIITWTT